MNVNVFQYVQTLTNHRDRDGKTGWQLTGEDVWKMNAFHNICHVSNAKLLFPQDSSLISGFLGGKKMLFKKVKKNY